ncbi:MAG: hypothetical protein AAGD32_03265 [Planctomycetota bacterium]
MLKLLAAVVAVLVLPGVAVAATLDYTEDFTGQNGKGAIDDSMDTSGVDWSIDVSQAGFANANDFFQVVDGVFTAQDIGGIAVWTSPGISNTAGSLLELTVDVGGDNNHESGDFLIVAYSVDGGSTFDDFYSFFGTDGDSTESRFFDAPTGTAQTTVTTTGLDLLIRVTVANNTGAEIMTFDNVSAVAIPEPFAVSAGMLGLAGLMLRRVKTA